MRYSDDYNCGSDDGDSSSDDAMYTTNRDRSGIYAQTHICWQIKKTTTAGRQADRQADIPTDDTQTDREMEVR